MNFGSKISAGPIANVLDDFHRAGVFLQGNMAGNIGLADEAEVGRLSAEVALVAGALQLGRTVLDKFPDMLAAQLTGRLLPWIGECPLIRRLVAQCDYEGLLHNCLVPLR